MIEDTTQHIVINTVPYHPQEIAYNENDNKFIESIFLNYFINFFFLFDYFWFILIYFYDFFLDNDEINGTTNMRLHDSQIPSVPYINSFSVGMFIIN